LASRWPAAGVERAEAVIGLAQAEFD